MDSLPTGATQSGFIVAAVALSPTITFFVAQVIGRVLRRRRLERQPGSEPVLTKEGAKGTRPDQAPPKVTPPAT
jgi:hypothetical protein